MKALRNFDAVIFDMDGVLIDSEPLWKIAMEDVFRQVGCPLTKEDFQQTVGLRLDEVIRYWFAVSPWEGASVDEVEKRIVQRMVELIKANGEPLVGVVETLHYLRAAGLKIGLGTSSYTLLIETVLETLSLTDHFDFVHSAEHETHGKPHPAVYLTVANRLHVDPTKCCVIEDSLTGVIAGKAARMTVVCIPEKSHFPNPKLVVADYQFETMTDLLTAWKS